VALFGNSTYNTISNNRIGVDETGAVRPNEVGVDVECSCYVNWQAHFLFCYCFSKGVCNFLGQLDPKVPGFQSRVFIFRLQTLQAKVLLLA